jgi:hypothetical protein
MFILFIPRLNELNFFKRLVPVTSLAPIGNSVLQASATILSTVMFIVLAQTV